MQSQNILVADPDMDTANMMDAYLTQKGHQVSLCAKTDGKSIINDFKRLVPDVLICELYLPGIDGFNVALNIRNDGYSDAVLIAHSAHYLDGICKQLDDGGFDFYSLKPTNLNAFDFAVLAKRQRKLVLLSTELQILNAREVVRAKILIQEARLACIRSAELILAIKENRKPRQIRRPVDSYMFQQPPS